ncbi:MAG TPA: hypothetical protein VJT31_37835 [Rugosimonospora sp.]|nr:hypothetical protein [Rugosimonospora sp.]
MPDPSRSAAGVLAATVAESPQPTLSGLVRRVAQRDQAAFADLYGLLSGEIGVRVGAQLIDPRQCAAVVYATFVELWRLAPAHADCPDSRAWVHAIADARSRELLRRREMPGRDPWWESFEAVHDSCRQQEFRALAGQLR